MEIRTKTHVKKTQASGATTIFSCKINTLYISLIYKSTVLSIYVNKQEDTTNIFFLFLFMNEIGNTYTTV